MRRVAVVVLTLSLAYFTATAYGQSPDATTTRVTMCDLYRNPERYADTVVEFRAVYMGRTTKQFWVDDFAPSGGCDAYMHLVAVVPKYVSPKPLVELEENSDWQKFVSNVEEGKRVEATFVGVFQPFFMWRDNKRVQVSKFAPAGSRKTKGFDGRILLIRVSDVNARYLPQK